MGHIQSPEAGEHDWLGVTDEPLPVVEAMAWAGDPSCGAVVTFCGVVRDHAEGRPGVSSLEYEAYLEHVTPKLASIASEAHERWPDLVRLVALHRVGLLSVGEPAVVVVASTPHRHAAFEAARWVIDTVKATAPIWKLETWDGGRAWSEACEVPVPSHPRPV